MSLTIPQRELLLTDIQASIEFSELPNTPEGSAVIALAYNLAADPVYIVWRTDVSIDEIMRNGMDWARVDNLSVCKARIWDWLGRLGTINASKVNVRAGIDATWVGTAADLAVRASVYTHCKRSATRVEKLFSTGIGSDASPGVMEFEGYLSWNEVHNSRNM
jgi:hypothetical protein